MTVLRAADLDVAPVDALVVDQYLASLLASASAVASTAASTAHSAASAATATASAAASAAGARSRAIAASARNAVPGGLDLVAAERVLETALVRVHPSFRFEERLAARLAGLAATSHDGIAAEDGDGDLAQRGGLLLAFPGAGPDVADALARRAQDDLLDLVLAGDLDPADADAVSRANGIPDRRPLLLGGAITSAALSVAGLAWVAWRTLRSPGAEPSADQPSATAPSTGLGGPA